MFESVDPWRDVQTDGRRLESHPIITPRAFRSGELKTNKIVPKSMHQDTNLALA